MYGVSSRSYPLWMSEGFAEFYSNAKFDKDGSVGLGLPATQRAMEIAYAKNVPIEHLLDTKTYLANKGKQHDEFYGRSWLLFHYLFFAETRKGQLGKYHDLLKTGTAELDAAKSAFGDLDALDKELGRYLKQKKLSYIKITASALSTGTINIRELDEGEAAIMPTRIRSKRGVTDKTAPELVPDARKIAAQFPQNAAVLSALAEVEFDAGNLKEAIVAADAAIAIDANNINARLQKAYALGRQADDISDEKSAKKAWATVRAELLKINAIENNHPIPLIQYYLTYARGGTPPTANAVQGLEWALALAPYDESLRFAVAQQQIFEERYDDAIDAMLPIANSPHQSEMTDAARKMIERAQAAKAGDKPSEEAQEEMSQETSEPAS
jgi:tetratricopeptide (TPR) repeat protein